ncbi:MAG TPA: hypothetical protein PLV00_07405 [Caldisericia bacterium]|nr:hypothetical protein [Caldisericia bacterium]
MKTNSHSSARPVDLAEESTQISSQHGTYPMQKKLLECYLETETDWNSFNTIAETLLAKPQLDLQLLLIVYQGYQKQINNSDMIEKSKRLLPLIHQYEPTTSEEVILLSTFYVDQNNHKKAKQLLKEGCFRFSDSESILYAYIDHCLEDKEYSEILTILTPDKLEKWNDSNLHLIYLQTFRLTNELIQREDYIHFLPYFDQIKQKEPQNPDIYIVQMSYLQDIPDAQIELTQILQEFLDRDISSRIFWNKAVLHSIQKCYIKPSQMALQEMEHYFDDPYEHHLVRFVQQLVDPILDFGTAMFLWNLFLERKNRVSTSFYLTCIDCAQSQLEKFHTNKSIPVTPDLIISLREFIRTSYQELHKLHPQGAYQLQKIAFLTTYDLESAEFEARNELQNNPSDQKLTILLANILYEKKEFNEAALYYRKISFDVLPWKETMKLQEKAFLALQHAFMQDELDAFVQEMKNSFLLPPYILKSLAQEALKRSIFMDLPEASEEAKTYAMQALKKEKDDPELVMLLVEILQKENQIPKALSLLDQYQTSSNSLFAFKRAVLLYTMFQKTGHSKYLEHADFELFSVNLPETFPENLSSQIAESIIKPLTMTETIAISPTTEFSKHQLRSSPGKLLFADSTHGFQIATACIQSSHGTGQLYCDSPYPYSLDKEWEVVKQCLHKNGIAPLEQINTFDWSVSLTPSVPLPYEPASFRFQLSLLLLSHIHNIDLGDLIVATFYSDLEGVLEPSQKTSLLLHQFAHNPHFQKYKILVPMGNLYHVVEELLLHPASFQQCIATPSLKSFYQFLGLH